MVLHCHLQRRQCFQFGLNVAQILQIHTQHLYFLCQSWNKIWVTVSFGECVVEEQCFGLLLPFLQSFAVVLDVHIYRVDWFLLQLLNLWCELFGSFRQFAFALYFLSHNFVVGHFLFQLRYALVEFVDLLRNQNLHFDLRLFLCGFRISQKVIQNQFVRQLLLFLFVFQLLNSFHFCCDVVYVSFHIADHLQRQIRFVLIWLICLLLSLLLVCLLCVWLRLFFDVVISALDSYHFV